MNHESTPSPVEGQADPYDPLLSTPRLPKTHSELYATPLGHVARSNTSAGAKKKLGQVATVPNRCLVTLSERPIQVSHVLARSTPRGDIWKLEEAWGIRFGHLNLDTTRNLIYLTADMHQMFDGNDWALVPSDTLLTRIARASALSQIPLFDNYISDDGDDYTFLPLGVFPKAFLHYRDQGFPKIHCPGSKFDIIPELRSHVHPFFVICNTAQKVISRRRSGTGSDLQYPKEITERLSLCIAYYEKWLETVKKAVPNKAPPDSSQRRPPSTHHSRSTGGRDDKSQQDRERSERSERRARRTEGQDPFTGAPNTSRNAGGSKQRRGFYNRPRASSLPTPEYTITDDGKPTLFGDAGPPTEELPDVGKWVAEVASSLVTLLAKVTPPPGNVPSKK